MANQVYFPQYKQIFEADPSAFVLISHPTTGRAYKIKISDFQSALDTIYNSNGVLNENRIVDANGNRFTFDDVTIFTVNASARITESVIVGDDTSNITLEPLFVELVSEDTNTGDFTTVYLENDNLTISTNPLGVEDNHIKLTSTELAISSETGNIELNVNGSNDHLELNIASGCDLRINHDAGFSGYVISSNGSANPPTWKKLSHSRSFVVGDWGVGTTLTITSAIHGLGGGYHNVTVFDSSHNIVPIGAVLTAVNVNGTSGTVTLTIVNNAAAFAGTAYIS